MGSRGLSPYPAVVTRVLVLLFLASACPRATPADVLIDADYNQWKRALGTNAATHAGAIRAPAGFQVELVRSAQPGEGSWVALAFDPKGRLVLAREDRGLLRLTLPADSAAAIRVETINTNLLECRGLLFAHGSLYANANNSKGLYRLRDTDGDDQFDEVKLLKATTGGVGHGRNQLALGPDGMIYSIHGDDVELPAGGVAEKSPLRHYAEDHLVPCEWDKVSFNSYAKPPFGHLIRTDPDGQNWELVAGGLRNPYGIAFNEAGDLFTYDADMEWDVGLPWYHPTRVLHLVPGGDYGWRRGTGVLPTWSADTLPSAVDIGVGSPTAVQFGTRSRFPEPWRRALFILDWAYGRIIAVHLKRDGPSYTGHSEIFLSGRPLNVTGIDFGPDGSMYFTTGGRRTQSGLYRVTWAGEPGGQGRAKAVEPGDGSEGPRYEELLKRLRSGSLDEVWASLNSSHHWTRYAARVALEERPVSEWQSRALAESRPNAAFTALLALSRTAANTVQPEILGRYLSPELAPASLTVDQRLLALRTLSVCFTRMGAPSPEVGREFLQRWEPLFPGGDSRVNQAGCELLVFLGSEQVVRKAMPLIADAATQNEKFHYLFLLRGVRTGWDLDQRRVYFDWLGRAGREFHGANTLPVALKFMRQEAEATLAPGEREGLREVLTALERPAAAARPAVARAFVRDWTMADLEDLVVPAPQRQDASEGRRLFIEAGCAQCHRLGTEGGVVGPDLTAVGSRFDRRALLESMIEPSKVIADVYRTVTVIKKDGEIVEGRVLADSGASLTLGTNPLDPQDRPQVIASPDIESRRVSDVSSMPAGLLNTLTKEEVRQLLDWLQGGGK